MRKSRFTESRIVAILKEGEAGVSIDELTRKHQISRATYFNWRIDYNAHRPHSSLGNLIPSEFVMRSQAKRTSAVAKV